MGLKRAAHHEISRAHLPNLDPTSGPSKKPKFDHRNPSTLAADAPEEDAILELDEIGRGGNQAKRNAVEIDGYSSDSSGGNFDERATVKAKNAQKPAQSKDEEDNDMFADLEEDEIGGDDDEDEELNREGKKKKEVRFMDSGDIEGQVHNSHGGGHVSADFSLQPDDNARRRRMAERQESDDESSEGELGDAKRDAVGDEVDEELGAGSKKKHAPRLDAFNMRNEADEGRFDEGGNFVRNAKDPFEVHDAWLEGNSNKATMRKAAQAEEQREKERRERSRKDDAVSTAELLAALISRMGVDETLLETLQRLNKGAEKRKKQPFKKNRRKNEMEVDTEDQSMTGDVEPAEAKRRENVEAITAAADQLLTRGQAEIYEAERALLERQYRRETGEAWQDPEPKEAEANGDSTTGAPKQWEYRWADARDGGETHGPYDGNTMKAWNDAGYFGEEVEFHQVGTDGWHKSVSFT